MPNSITLGKNYVPLLDEIYKVSSKTAVLDGDTEMAREGANPGELVVAKMSLQGQAAYNRSTGYVNGDVTLEWETVPADYDRGRMFAFDSVDNEDTFNTILGNIAGEYIRTQVDPELDAYRIAKYAGTAGIGSTSAALTTGAAAIAAIRVAVDAMDNGEVSEEDRYLFVTPTIKGLIDDLDTTKSREVMDRFADIIVVPQTRMYTVIDLYDGTSSGETAGGYIKDATNGKNINFLAVAKSAVLQIPKHVAPKIVTPEQNQSADSYKFGYRFVGINKVLDNKKAGIYCHYSTN